MASTLLLSVQNAEVSFGEKRLFTDLTFNIQEGDKISLVGKNGTGKTTLMNIITGIRELDDGKRWQMPGISIGHLQQDIKPKPGQTVHDFVFEGLTKESVEEGLTYKIEMIVEPLHLNVHDMMDKLSGGQLRRAALARALVEAPDILLLDEPTNHLDLEIIEWLEGYLMGYRGAILVVSHDRTFLSNISDKVFWLDRGKIKVSPRGFAHFEEWSTMLLEQEERELHNRQKIVDQEVEWANRGVKARRKRNVRRLELVKEERERLRRDKHALSRMLSKVEFSPMDAEVSFTNLVAEFHKVEKSYTTNRKGEPGTKTILHNFNMRLMRGDRIGIVGKNGSGKTSFLKMLVGEMQPDSGRVKTARDLVISYLDQHKVLKPTDTMRDILCPNGGDYIEVMGKKRHVCGYIKDFLFDPRMVDEPTGTLSGGQKNRLMLAKVLANPGGLLVLDEPTNDLDMDTLDMLEEMIANYKGTLVVVSHDRDFLDQTVSKIVAFEGDGVVEAHIGGYNDYIEAKRGGMKGEAAAETKTPKAAKMKEETAAAPVTEAAKPQKLSYKITFELSQLPEKIKKLESDIASFEAQLADPALYMRDPDEFDRASRRLDRAKRDLDTAETRWLELEEIRIAAGQ